MPRARFGALVVVLAGLALSGCTGSGAGHPARTGTSPSGSATPGATANTPSAPPAPLPITAAAAAAVVDRYDRVVSGAVLASDRATLSRLQGGAVLAASLAEARESDALSETPEPPRPVGPATVYILGGLTYPQRFLAEAPDAQDAGRTELSVFERASATAPWRKVLLTEAQGHVLPPPALVAGAMQRSGPDRAAQALAAVAAVSRYMATAQAPALLTDTALADQYAQTARNNRQSPVRSRITMTCVPDRTPLLSVLTTAPEIHVLTRIRCAEVFLANRGLSYPLDAVERAWSHGAIRARRLEYDEDVQVAVAVQPDGQAQLVGYHLTRSRIRPR